MLNDILDAAGKLVPLLTPSYCTNARQWVKGRTMSLAPRLYSTEFQDMNYTTTGQVMNGSIRRRYYLLSVIASFVWHRAEYFMKATFVHHLQYFLLAMLILGSAGNNSVRADELSAFTVACILPLSGRFAEYGAAAKNGIELARENRPELFAHIRFLYEDSLYDGRTAITAFHKFVAVDHADLVFVWGHGPVQAVAPVAEGSRKPAVLVSGQRDVADRKKYVVRFCSPHVAYANALLKEVRRKGYKNIAVVKTELGFLNDTVDALSAGIRSPETFEIVDSFQPGETDFQSTLAKLKSRDYDLLGLFLGEDQVPLFLSRMITVKLHPPLFGTHSLGGKEAIAAVQRYSDSAFLAANYVDANFHEQYSSTFGGDIQIPWASNAYDFAVLTAELFASRKNKATAEQIIEAYQGVKGRTGVTGTYSFVINETLGTGFVFPVVVKTITK